MDTSPTYELHFLEHGPAEHVGHVLLLQVLEGLPDARTQVPDTLSHLHFPKGNKKDLSQSAILIYAVMTFKVNVWIKTVHSMHCK